MQDLFKLTTTLENTRQNASLSMDRQFATTQLKCVSLKQLHSARRREPSASQMSSASCPQYAAGGWTPKSESPIRPAPQRGTGEETPAPPSCQLKKQRRSTASRTSSSQMEPLPRKVAALPRIQRQCLQQEHECKASSRIAQCKRWVQSLSPLFSVRNHGGVPCPR
jgi:hypothetical protein